MTRIATTLLLLATTLVYADIAFADGVLTREDVRNEVRAYLDQHAQKSSKQAVQTYWRHGLFFESGDVKVNFGGRALIDVSFFDDGDAAPNGRIGNLEDGIQFHQVWLRTVADFGKHVQGKIQIAFESGEIKFQDVFVDIHNLRDCIGCGFPNVRVGHFFEPFSLNATTPGTRLTFMERALPTTFAPFRNSGIMLHDDFRGGRFGYAVGIFGNANRVGESNFEQDGYAATARAWWTPWNECDCECKKLHLGVSYSHRWDLNGVRYASRPEDHLSRVLVDTSFTTAPGPMGAPLLNDADEVDLLAAELALVYGRFSIQAEYIRADVQSVAGADPTFDGWYAFASYWLTGSCRKYARGGFGGRVVPCCSFLDKGCSCAGDLELAVRFSTIDLNDGNINGGEMSDWTVGLNWHLNPNARIMLNYIHSNVDDDIASNQKLNIFALRFQVDF